MLRIDEYFQKFQSAIAAIEEHIYELAASL